MAKKIKSIVLSPEDTLLKKWMSISSKNRSTNNICLAAIEYYAKTGKFLNIGKININTNPTKTNNLVLRYDENSYIDRWFQGDFDSDDFSSYIRKNLIVKDLLVNGIELTDEDSSLPTMSYLISALRDNQTAHYKEIKKEASASKKENETVKEDILTEKESIKPEETPQIPSSNNTIGENNYDKIMSASGNTFTHKAKNTDRPKNRTKTRREIH